MKFLFIVPHLFTFLNVFFGFLAILNIFSLQFVTAAYCIIAAIAMDFIDGRLARALHTSSYLGMELDSLCDAISFCLAPAVLLFAWRLSSLGWFAIFVLTAYLCAGLLRLAKYNTLTVQHGTMGYFIGLPTPIAALVIASFVLFHQSILVSPFYVLLYPTTLLFLVAFLAILMISPFRFPSFKRFTFNNFKRKKR